MFNKTVGCLAALAMLAAPAPAQAAGLGYSRSEHQARLMSLIVTQTNQIRDEAGCPQLEVDQDLIVASVRQSAYMAETRRFGHTGWNGSTFAARARAAGYAEPAGENVAWGYDSATEVMQAWLDSPPHRANILNCDARSIGTGVRYAEDGTPYWTQVFGWV